MLHAHVLYAALHKYHSLQIFIKMYYKKYPEEKGRRCRCVACGHDFRFSWIILNVVRFQFSRASHPNRCGQFLFFVGHLHPLVVEFPETFSLEEVRFA